MHLIAFSFEAASDGNLIPSNKNTPRLNVGAFAILMGKGIPYEHPITYYFCALCYFQKVSEAFG